MNGEIGRLFYVLALIAGLLALTSALYGAGERAAAFGGITLGCALLGQVLTGSRRPGAGD